MQVAPGWSSSAECPIAAWIVTRVDVVGRQERAVGVAQVAPAKRAQLGSFLRATEATPEPQTSTVRPSALQNTRSSGPVNPERRLTRSVAAAA